MIQTKKNKSCLTIRVKASKKPHISQKLVHLIMAFCSHLYLSAFLERFIGENILLIPNFGTLLVDCEELGAMHKNYVNKNYVA